MRQNPDLIVSHLSCLLDERFAEPEREGPLYDHLFALAKCRLMGVFGYVASANPRTRFLVLRGRVHTWNVPGNRTR